MRRRAERALAELGAAAPLGAVCLLVVNDHQFKRLFHNTLTGKLSDIAICFLLPLLVSAALGLLSDWSGRRRLTFGAVMGALVFTLLELSDAAGAMFVHATGAVGLGGGTLTRDPTDLLALACVPLAVAYGRRRLAIAERGANIWRSATGALVMATGSLALMATMSVCGEWAAPVVFQVQGDCGPSGLIIVESGEFRSLRVYNAQALGLPQLPAGQEDNGIYMGNACPSSLTQGGWVVSNGGLCIFSDAGTEPSTHTCPADYRGCSATVESGDLFVTCHGGALPDCRSQLTVVP